MAGVQIDGNNILTVYDTIKGVREYCIKNQKPFLIECMTFRMRGHEEASGVKYVPKHLFEEWEKKDPLNNYETYLKSIEVLSDEDIFKIKADTKNYIEEELKIAYCAKLISPDTAEELNDVYAKSDKKVDCPPVRVRMGLIEEKINLSSTHPEKKFIHGITDALRLSMQKYPNLTLMGQDIAEYGGAFKVTEGFVNEFGKERVRNTPLCESAIVGACLGMSLEGFKTVMEMQFADFATVGFNQIINNLAKIHYRWGQNADVVIRMPTGGGVGAGPFHSQSNEAWFVHTPGLKVVYPSSPMDAKGLLIAAINDPNPVLFFEHKALYRSVSGMLPEAYYEIEIGKAKVVLEKEQADISIITYGAGVHWAMDYAHKNPAVSLYILDLRTLLPLDYNAIKKAVIKTGKVLILHEDTLTGGIGGEISAWISENCFDALDAPIMRCAGLDTPIPFSIELEKNFMANARLEGCIKKLLEY